MTAGYRSHPSTFDPPGWWAVIVHACRRHAADVAVVVLTLAFVAAVAAIGLTVLHHVR